MSRAIFAKKLGMTQVFTDAGKAVPVTVLLAPPCRVVRVKTDAQDGYQAAVVAIGSRRKASRPVAGQTKALGITPERIRELRGLDGSIEAGHELTVDQFEAGAKVDVSGLTKGKGFSGVIKRWNFHRGPMGHGSKYHRRTGSLGPRMSGGGGKVFRGRKMPGRYGHELVTVQNLIVVAVHGDQQLILVQGAVPGPRGTLLKITDAIKGRVRA
ncbi:MAG: 50S ribosomal protein L3 [Sulfobacillus sp.]